VLFVCCAQQIDVTSCRDINAAHQQGLSDCMIDVFIEMESHRPLIRSSPSAFARGYSFR
jgi:hypothetical protein